MYVIGITDFSFLNIKLRILRSRCDILKQIEKVTYDCSLTRATILQDYETAIKIIKEIKDRKNEILFENDSILGEILNKGKKFDVENLKVYQLIAAEIKVESEEI